MSDNPEPDAPVDPPATETDPEPGPAEAPPPAPPYVEEPGNPQTNDPLVPVSPPELDPGTPRQPDAAASRAYKDSIAMQPAVLFDPHLERYVPDLSGAIQGADAA